MAYFEICHWHWRLAHGCCFVDQLAFSPSPEKQVRIGLATEVREGPRNMVQTDGVIAYDVAACTQDTCCKTSRHLCSYNIVQKRNSTSSQGEGRPNSGDLRASTFLAAGACQ